MKCRHCNSTLIHQFLDLGFAPPSNAYLSKNDLNKPESYFPLRLFVCHHCWLVQTEDFAQAELYFNKDYAYFSSTSKHWLKHAKDYSELIIDKLSLTSKSFVVEIASNDGYLLKNFIKSEIPCLGIEPTESTAMAAEKLGIPVIKEFFCEALSQKLTNDGKQADLIIGNNVYAHVPDINDFTQGIEVLLAEEGVVTLEFPHLLSLLALVQFDTVYHEHFSYLSLTTVNNIFSSAGLRIYDIEQLSTHGGSLRVYGCRLNDKKVTSPRVKEMIDIEKIQGLQTLEIYTRFQQKVDLVKNKFIEFLIHNKNKKMKVVAYGAAAKGNTLINYAGVKPDLLPVVFDAAASKQGMFLPGSHIPIRDPQEMEEWDADLVIITPWNLKDEIISSLKKVLNPRVTYVTFVPTIEIWD